MKNGWLFFDEAVYQYQKKTVRKMILKDHKRPDGRQITQIRPLAAEVDIIPSTWLCRCLHVDRLRFVPMTTLAPLSEAQRIDGLDEFETSKRYMHHYNFPSYSVGETKPSRDRDVVRSVMVHLQRELFVPVLSRQQKSSHMRSVQYLRLLNPMVPLLRQVSVHLRCLLMAAGVPILRTGSRYFLWSGNRRYR